MRRQGRFSAVSLPDTHDPRSLASAVRAEPCKITCLGYQLIEPGVRKEPRNRRLRLRVPRGQAPRRARPAPQLDLGDCAPRAARNRTTRLTEAPLPLPFCSRYPAACRWCRGRFQPPFFCVGSDSRSFITLNGVHVCAPLFRRVAVARPPRVFMATTSLHGRTSASSMSGSFSFDRLILERSDETRLRAGPGSSWR